MVFLKEDGSLDNERINKLPIEEFANKIELMTEEEYKAFVSKQMINESQEPVRMVKVNYTLEDDIKSNGMVIAEDFINKMRKKYVIIK